MFSGKTAFERVIPVKVFTFPQIELSVPFEEGMKAGHNLGTRGFKQEGQKAATSHRLTTDAPAPTRGRRCRGRQSHTAEALRRGGPSGSCQCMGTSCVWSPPLPPWPPALATRKEAPTSGHAEGHAKSEMSGPGHQRAGAPCLHPQISFLQDCKPAQSSLRTPWLEREQGQPHLFVLDVVRDLRAGGLG